MKSSSTINSFVSKSNNVASFIVASRDLYWSILNFFNPGRLLKKLLSAISKWCFFLLLKIFNRGLNKSSQDSVDLVLSTNNYLTVRMMSENLGKSIHSLSAILPEDFKYEGNSFIDKKIFQSITKMIFSMKSYKESLDNSIAEINVDSKKESNGFVLIPETQIWERRNKAYQYKF